VGFVKLIGKPVEKNTMKNDEKCQMKQKDFDWENKKCGDCGSSDIILHKAEGFNVIGFDVTGYTCHDCNKYFPFSDVKWK